MDFSPINGRLHVTGRAGGPALVEAGRMRFAVADRDRLGALREFGDDWLAIGAYVLLGLASEPAAAFAAYAGKATGRRGLLGRAEAQRQDQRWWRRAVLIARNDAHGFDSAQAGWLEGELIAYLQAAAHIECRNSQADSDASLHPFEADDMQAQFAVVFQPLVEDYDLFCAASVDHVGGTICWPSGADLSPRALYAEGKAAVPGHETTVALPADIHQIDETGYVWAVLEEAYHPERVQPGRLVVAGDAEEPFTARVVDIVPGGAKGTHIVHLDLEAGTDN